MNNDGADHRTSELFAEVIPILRGLLADPTGDPDRPHATAIVRSLTSREAIDFAAADQHTSVGPLPAPLAEGGPPPLFLSLTAGEDAEALRKRVDSAITDYVGRHKTKPAIVCLRGMGVAYVADQEVDSPPLPLANKVALVTGAAGAIGCGVCVGLLANGCHLAASDLPGDRLDRFTAELAETGGDRVIGVPMDVTDKDSVAAGFETIIQTWGGVDIVVVNAGIAMVTHLKDMDLAAFRRLERVNVEGTLLTLSQTARHMIRQGTGGDIIVMSTKNVPSPGAGFGAYSATKAACHQLGRIASIELAPHGVRVNMVAPDAVFSEGDHKSGLWEEVGPDRMRARNLDEEGLHEYYRSRNLLKARITGRHVSNAVLFFATRQTPTTGATIPVDGGLPDATPR